MKTLFRRKPKASSGATVASDTSHRAPTTFPSGIKTFHSGETSCVDVVFIHGLTGDRERTWTAPDAAAPWPSTILPSEIPNARILTFGYDAYVVDWRSMVSKNRIGNHAMDLLTSLVTYREKEDTNDRPIIFVCHSLGGLVCEDALNLSRQSPEKHLQKILLSTRGIAFLGTPHRGAGLAKWAVLLADFIGLLKQTNASILETLERESEVLERIQESFFAVLRVRDQERLPPIKIACFIEELPLPGVGIVVPRESAAIPSYPSMSIHQDHMSMTKFATRNDPGFLALVGELQRWTKELKAEQGTTQLAASPRSLTTSEKAYIMSFGPSCYIDIDDRVDGTCVWSTETPEYKLWKDQDQPAILWLTGNAGCGKTILTNFLVQHLVQQEQPRQSSYYSALVCSFFCVRDREAQHDVRSLLRDLIRQILISMKEVVHEVKALFGSTRHEYDPSFETLWRIFEQLIQLAPCQYIYIAIDALDECEEKSKLRLLSKITTIMKVMSRTEISQRKRLKIIISGQIQRRKTGHAMTEIGQYYLDIDPRSDRLAHDVIRFIDFKVDQLISESICSESTSTTLKLKLRSMSENSFLWLRVVIEHIRNSLSYREVDIKQLLDEVPLDLQDAYAEYLPNLLPTGLPLLQKYLRLLVACARPLSLVELDNFANIDSGVPETSDSNVVMSSVRRALGPMVKFPNNTVQFLHSTAKDFFVLLSTQMQHRYHASHGVEVVSAHLFCAVSCMKYVTAEAIVGFFEQHVSDAESYSASPITPRHTQLGQDDSVMLADLFDVEDVSFLKDEDDRQAEIFALVRERLGAYDYAARNWTYHFAHSEHIADEAIIDRAIELLSCLSEPLSNWYRYAAHFSWVDMPAIHELDPVVLAAFFNHVRTLRQLLARGTYAPTTFKLHRALFWAAARGNCEPVSTLLEYGVLVDDEVSDSTPLTVTIRGGFSDAFQLILDTNKANLNKPDREGKPPLVLAAAFNHSQILQLLLRQSSIQVNVLDFSGRTALSNTCAHKSDECLNALIQDSRTDYNLKDYNGYTALHLASQFGNDHAIRCLSATPEVRIDALTATGRNALSLAAQNGHLSVVRRLCHKGLSAAQEDVHGRNAISWACNSMKGTNRSGAESVLQYLVRKFPEAANAPDKNGWTPLAWTMDPPGYLDAVKMLLGSRFVDVNQLDGTNGRTVLAWAASQGFQDIVQVLLQVPGVEKNSLSHDGRSPLSYAAANGMYEVVKLLLNDKDVLVTSPDASGRKPIEWAALNGHLGIVSLLEEAISS